MAAMDLAENSVEIDKNPYHVSFKLCAEEGRKKGDERNQQAPVNRYRDTFYDEYLKPKMDFHCDLCDRSFWNENQLNAHNAQHVTCGQDGCTFTAHEKIVATHVRVQHATGIYRKIKKLNNPEEIKKWLAERKRKYPTILAAENKKKLAAAKKKRGETIEVPKERFNEAFNRTRKGGKFRRTNLKARGRNKRANAKKRKISAIIEEDTPEIECNGSIPAFRGLGSLAPDVEEEPMEEAKFDISDEEDVHISSNTVESQVPQSLIDNSLGLLMNAYDSDALTDDPDETSKPAVVVTPVTQPIAASDDEAPEEVVTVKSKLQTLPEPPVPPVNTMRRKSKRQLREDRSKRPYVHVQQPPKPTLLQKLLTPDINRERTIIRQCVHYVLENNFFHDQAEKQEKLPAKQSEERYGRKSRLLEKLLKDDIVHERNMIMQCVRFVVDNNFFDKS